MKERNAFQERKKETHFRFRGKNELSKKCEIVKKCEMQDNDIIEYNTMLYNIIQ